MTAPVPQDAEYAPPPRRTRIRQRSEADIVASALDLLRGTEGAYARKVHGGPMGNAGEPDIDACVRGRAVKLEAKRSGQKPTPAQWGAMHRWSEAGALVGWFTSNDHVLQILEHLAEREGYQPDPKRPGCGCPLHDREVA